MFELDYNFLLLIIDAHLLFIWFGKDFITTKLKLGERLSLTNFNPNFPTMRIWVIWGLILLLCFKVKIDASRKWANPSLILVY